MCQTIRLGHSEQRHWYWQHKIGWHRMLIRILDAEPADWRAMHRAFQSTGDRRVCHTWCNRISWAMASDVTHGDNAAACPHLACARVCVWRISTAVQMCGRQCQYVADCTMPGHTGVLNILRTPWIFVQLANHAMAAPYLVSARAAFNHRHCGRISLKMPKLIGSQSDCLQMRKVRRTRREKCRSKCRKKEPNR